MPLDMTGDVGPMFLARSPTWAPPPEPVSAWPSYFDHLTQRFNALRTWRWSWWVSWARCAEFILPYRYKWLITSNTMNRGLPFNDRIIDETALLAMQVCGHGLASGLMSGDWLKLGAGLSGGPVNSEVADWLAITQDRLYTVLDGSNFYTAMDQAFRDVATFGTAPLHIAEDFEDVIRCYLPCAGEYYLGVGGRLSNDTFYREFTYTVEQLVNRFHLENCPEEIQKFWWAGGASLEREFVVIHSIEPNFPIAGRSGGKASKLYLVPSSFEWRSVYWLRGIQGDAPLEARGEHEQPFAVAAWTRTSNDAYGRGPGMDALAATRQLQHEQERKAEFIDKGVRPPMVGDPELQNKPASILSGELTFVNTSTGKKGFWPAFEVNPGHLAPMVEDIKEVQARIERCFFVDVFKWISQMEGIQPRNELEISERRNETLQQLGPIVRLFETEFAPIAIHRVLRIMQRRGLLPPPPQAMRGLALTVSFVSTLKRAQIAAETAGLERGLATMGQMSEAAIAAGQPSPARTVDLDKYLRLYFNKIEVPMSVMRSDREVKAADLALAKQKQAAAASQGLMAATQAAGNLSQVDTGNGQNAVSMLLGRPGGGSPP